MKAKQILLLLFIPLFAIQCKKEPESKDYPCADHASYFSCNINGEPFITRGFDGCGSYNIWYDRNTGNLSISGRDCKASFHEPYMVNFYLFGVFQEQLVNPVQAGCKYLTETNSIRYDSTLSGYVSVDQLILDNYSEDYSGAVVSGTFEFTLWNPTLNDTAYITDGSFCMPF